MRLRDTHITILTNGDPETRRSFQHRIARLIVWG